MRLRLLLIAVVGAFWLSAEISGLHDVDRSPVYLYGTGLLLAIGLYGSTYGIDLAEARRHRRIILSAVTVGVLVKAVIIGGVLYAATRDPLFLVLGVAVAQIDPLSVASVMGDGRLSPRTRTILSAWASFDDPLTVILAVYASAVVTDSFGVGRPTGQGVAGGLVAYAVDLGLNLVLAGVAYVAWRGLRRWPGLLGAALALLAAVAIWQFLMLGVAIAGLFVRPAALAPWVGRITNGALLVSGALLGLLLVDGVNLGYGAALGAMAFASQAIVGTILTRGLPGRDRVHLALAQQNGITAIILSLRLEVQFAGAVAIVAPAIVVTNVIYLVANRLADGRRR